MTFQSSSMSLFTVLWEEEQKGGKREEKQTLFKEDHPSAKCFLKDAPGQGMHFPAVSLVAGRDLLFRV